MKLKNILISFLVTGFILFSFQGSLLAQGDSSFYKKALFNATNLYHQAFGTRSALYNGVKYGEYLFRFTEGHQFFNSQLPSAGSVTYDGVMYDSILMRYDEVSDVLVINDRSDRIQLLSDRVQYFSLFNSDFVRIEKDSLTSELVSSGFYNVLYAGKFLLLKKQVKTVREVISSTSELQHFADAKDHYYIKKDDRAYTVKNKKDLLRLFGDRKKEVQQFIKVNKLSFRNDKQNLLVKTAAYYDSLKK